MFAMADGPGTLEGREKSLPVEKTWSQRRPFSVALHGLLSRSYGIDGMGIPATAFYPGVLGRIQTLSLVTLSDRPSTAYAPWQNMCVSADGCWLGANN